MMNVYIYVFFVFCLLIDSQMCINEKRVLKGEQERTNRYPLMHQRVLEALPCAAKRITFEVRVDKCRALLLCYQRWMLRMFFSS